MICYDIIDVSEGNGFNRTSVSKQCDICPYWYFLNYSFKFQPNFKVSVSVSVIDVNIY